MMIHIYHLSLLDIVQLCEAERKRNILFILNRGFNSDEKSRSNIIIHIISINKDANRLKMNEHTIIYVMMICK